MKDAGPALALIDKMLHEAKEQRARLQLVALRGFVKSMVREHERESNRLAQYLADAQATGQGRREANDPGPGFVQLG